MQKKIQFQENPGGKWRIFVRPQAGDFYCVGADSASGMPGRNGSAAHILNINKHRVDAVLAANISPEVLADELEKAGYWYNTATLAVEAMFHGLLVNFKLLEKHYPMLFQQDSSVTSYGTRLSSEIGWKQTEANRNLMLSLLQADRGFLLSKDPKIKAKALICRDKPTLEEMTHFQRNQKGKAEAESGFSDDRVMSLAIANGVYHTLLRSLPQPAQAEKPPTVWEQWDEIRQREMQPNEIVLGELSLEIGY